MFVALNRLISLWWKVNIQSSRTGQWKQRSAEKHLCINRYISVLADKTIVMTVWRHSGLVITRRTNANETCIAISNSTSSHACSIHFRLFRMLCHAGVLVSRPSGLFQIRAGLNSLMILQKFWYLIVKRAISTRNGYRCRWNIDLSSSIHSLKPF